MKPQCIATVVVGLALVGACAGCGEPEPRRPPPPPPDRLTLEEEVALGRAAAPAVAEVLGGESDQLAVQAYVRTVGQRVARSTRFSAPPYRFAVLKADEPRSVALPGGVVCVTQGLLRRLDTEAQLAAALGRQLAHLAAGHVRRTLTDRFSLAVLREASAVGAVPAGRSADPEAVRRVAQALIAPSYGVDQEAEADRLGLDYLAAAGYNPSEMADCLQRLGEGQERAERIRAVVTRKYADRRGRIADEVYSREVLDRFAEP